MDARPRCPGHKQATCRENAASFSMAVAVLRSWMSAACPYGLIATLACRWHVIRFLSGQVPVYLSPASIGNTPRTGSPLIV